VEEIVNGEFQSPFSKTILALPPFCRVAVLSAPAKSSNIHIEVWLPEHTWNGRLLGTGNGGGAGRISYGPLAAGIERGFATANTDLGTAPDANQVIGFPDRWTDFGHRATHEMTRIAKAIIANYYGEPAKRSYFSGCSTGGQQGLSEAEHYPADYDGIIAGAPANNRTHLHSEFLWNYQAAHQVAGKSMLPPDRIAFVTRSILAACVGKDGGAPDDGFLTDPRSCKFKLASLPICSADGEANCVSREQLATLERIYAGPTNPRTEGRIYAPLPFGTESSNLGLTYQEDSSQLPKQQFYPFLWAFGADWNPMKFNFDRDEDRVDQKLAPLLNANSSDLTVFEKDGGRLIMFTGTADPIVPFPDTIAFYERVIAFERQQSMSMDSADALVRTQQFFRYYLVPGMGHCSGGPGLNNFGQGISLHDNDLLFKLENWVEHGVAPDQLLASGSRYGSSHAIIQRNLCPYPELPTYGGGDAKLETSFRCISHPRGDVPVPAAWYLH